MEYGYTKIETLYLNVLIVEAKAGAYEEYQSIPAVGGIYGHVSAEDPPLSSFLAGVQPSEIVSWRNARLRRLHE